MTAPDIRAEFADRVAVVTGGGSGIGRAIAVRWAAAGGTVAVLGRREEALNETVALAEQAGGTGIALPCDVRDAAAVDAAIDSVVERTGRLDALVNNAAGNFVVPGENLSPNGWKAVIDIVLNGTFYCTRAASRHMLAAGSGVDPQRDRHLRLARPPRHRPQRGSQGRRRRDDAHARGRVGCARRAPQLHRPGSHRDRRAGAALWPTDEARSQVLSSVPAGPFHHARRGRRVRGLPALRRAPPTSPATSSSSTAASGWARPSTPIRRRVRDMQSTVRTGGQALVDALARHGVDVVFGIPGTHNLSIYAALAESGIEHVSPRHEQGAGYACRRVRPRQRSPRGLYHDHRSRHPECGSCCGAGILGFGAGPVRRARPAARSPEQRQRLPARGPGPVSGDGLRRRSRTTRHERRGDPSRGCAVLRRHDNRTSASRIPRDSSRSARRKRPP